MSGYSVHARYARAILVWTVLLVLAFVLFAASWDAGSVLPDTSPDILTSTQAP